jgi:DNA primase
MNELEEIKSKVDIVELIGGYVQLKQTGKNFKACCPFHAEKTPSFIVSPERQMWHCFGSCNEGGDIFSFVMKVDGLTFPETVESLANRAGVKLEKRNFEKNEAKAKLYSANELAADFYHSLLLTPTGKVALDYLRKNRGMTDKTIKDFNLGYSPLEKDALQKELAGHKFTTLELERAGLVAKKSGEDRDLFWKRLMFPIRDISGRTVGFSARTLDKDGVPKYINTPATEIYDKSSVLYGIDLAKESIRKMNYCIVVEGNMDVIASYQAGVKNVVASSGTALTEMQLKLLARLTKNLKFAFDIDFAGSEATRRAIEMAWNMGFNIKIVTVPSGKDAADAVAEDPKIWKGAVKDAKYVVDYLFDSSLEKHNRLDPIGRKTIAKDLLPVIKRIPDEIERDTYIKKLSKELSVDESSIIAAMAKVAAPKKAEATIEKPKAYTLENKNIELERNILGLLVSFPHYLDYAVGTIEPEDFTSEDTSQPYKKLISYYNKKGEVEEKKFLASLNKEESERFNVFILSAENTFADFDDEKKAEEIYFGIKRLKKISLEHKKRKLSDAIAEYEKSGAKKEANDALSALQQLLEEEKKIS